jgi:hypothetical protein
VSSKEIILDAAVSLKCSSTSAHIQSSTCIGKVGGFLDPLFRNTPVLRASLDAGSNGSVESVSSKTIRVVCFSALSRVRSGSKVVHPDQEPEVASSEIDWRFRQLGSPIVD